nr:hypothetical protein [Atopobiaceae bacterium]
PNTPSVAGIAHELVENCAVNEKTERKSKQRFDILCRKCRTRTQSATFDSMPNAQIVTHAKEVTSVAQAESVLVW